MDLVAGMVGLTAVSLAPLAVLVALHRRRQLGVLLRALLGVLVQHLPFLPAPIPDPNGPPLEALAAKLRRLRPLVTCETPGLSVVKHRGTLAAYDDALVAASRALDVVTSLADLPPEGFEREAERLRVEHALGRAGLVWQPPGG